MLSRSLREGVPGGEGRSRLFAQRAIYSPPVVNNPALSADRYMEPLIYCTHHIVPTAQTLYVAYLQLSPFHTISYKLESQNCRQRIE